MGKSARQRQLNAHKPPKFKHWAPAPSQASEASQSLYKTHDSSHCNQPTSPQCLAKVSPPLKCSLRLAPSDLPAAESALSSGTSTLQLLWPEVGRNNGIYGLQSIDLVAVALIEIKKKKVIIRTGHQTSTLSTTGLKKQKNNKKPQPPHFFGPNCQLCQKCFVTTEKSTFRV